MFYVFFIARFLNASHENILVHCHNIHVTKGAEKVNQAISAAHKSAHADDLAGVESHFKEFSEALRDLEQQMKKQ